MPELVISRTKSQQVSNYLEEKIRSGQLKHGERLQTVRELAALFNVSTIVVNSAYDELEKKNLVERCGRRGVFVNDPGKKTKCFLVINYSAFGSIEYSATYILPAFKARCISLGIQTEEVYGDFLRNGNVRELIRQFREQSYDGALLIGSGYVGNEQEVIILQELGIPVLIPHAPRKEAENLGFSGFYTNDRQAWFDAMKLLVERGYRKIGALGTCRPDFNRCILRCGDGQTHLQMLHSLGVDGSDEAICYLTYGDPKQFQEKLGQWLGDGGKFDAIMCFSDFYALRLYEYCKNHGIRIPKDLAVTGFCGYPGGNLLQPGLSTIDLNYKSIGEQAADFLLNAGKHNMVQYKETLHKLIERGSTPSKTT